jgi:hypothetical protein
MCFGQGASCTTDSDCYGAFCDPQTLQCKTAIIL